MLPEAELLVYLNENPKLSLRSSMAGSRSNPFLYRWDCKITNRNLNDLSGAELRALTYREFLGYLIQILIKKIMMP